MWRCKRTHSANQHRQASCRPAALLAGHTWEFWPTTPGADDIIRALVLGQGKACMLECTEERVMRPFPPTQGKGSRAHACAGQLFTVHCKRTRRTRSSGHEANAQHPLLPGLVDFKVPSCIYSLTWRRPPSQLHGRVWRGAEPGGLQRERGVRSNSYLLARLQHWQPQQERCSHCTAPLLLWIAHLVLCAPAGAAPEEMPTLVRASMIVTGKPRQTIFININIKCSAFELAGVCFLPLTIAGGSFPVTLLPVACHDGCSHSKAGIQPARPWVLGEPVENCPGEEAPDSSVFREHTLVHCSEYSSIPQFSSILPFSASPIMCQWTWWPTCCWPLGPHLPWFTRWRRWKISWS